MLVRRLLLRLATAAALAALALTAPATAQAGPSVYWGANIGDHLTGGSPPYDMTAADAFETMVGRQMSLIEYSLPWADCTSGPCQDVPFPAAQMQAIRDRGALPVFGWASYSQPLSLDEPDFRLARIIDGSHDAFIRRWAQDARNWGGPFFLVFNWEMNLKGIWPYGEADNGNQAGEYVRAWRHVHDIFTAEGVGNATWVWCANTMFDTWSSQLAGLYPGDAYVDWTCIDGYKWPSLDWSFSDLIGPTYDRVQAIAPTKPVLIGETAAAEAKPKQTMAKPAWITDGLGTLTTHFPNIKGLVWFEKVEPGLSEYHADARSWLVESTPASLEAFRGAIGSPVFAGPGAGPVSGKIAPLTPVVLAPSPAPGPPPAPTPGPDPGPGPAPVPTCWDKPLSASRSCRRGPLIESLRVRASIPRTLGHTGISAWKGATFAFRVRSSGWLTVRFQRRSGKRPWRTVKGKLVLPVTVGRRGLTFNGRISAKLTLRPGRYRVLFGGRDRSGRRAKAVTARFVLRVPRHR